MENLGWGYVDNVDNSVDRFYYWKPSSTGIDKKAGKLEGTEKVVKCKSLPQYICCPYNSYHNISW